MVRSSSWIAVQPAPRRRSVARSASSTAPPLLTVRNVDVASARGTGGDCIMPSTIQPPGRNDCTILDSAVGSPFSGMKNVGTHAQSKTSTSSSVVAS